MADPSNEHLIRMMEERGVSREHVERVIGIRDRMRASVSGFNLRGDEMSDAASMINASLEKIGSQIQGFRSETEQQVGGLSARLQSLEQVVAAGDLHRGASYGDAPSVGASAVEAFQADHAFAAAEEAARRGSQPSQFNARVNVDSSIRAVLVGEDWGGVDDTEVPSQPQRRGMRGGVVAPLRLLSVLPSRSTNSDSVEFIQIDPTEDEADYQLTHGAEKAEIELEGTLKRAYVATIAAHTTASKQVLADHSALRQQIDRVIRNKVASKLEYELLNGDGSPGKINGLLNQSVTMLPTYAETPADVVGEALTVQQIAGFQPSLVIVNPWDWFLMQTEKVSDQDGRYLFGSPTSPMAPKLWGGRVVQTPLLARGTALTIDTSYVTVLDREQMSVTASNSHGTNFIKNLITILGELRAGLEVIDTRAVQKVSLNGIVPPTS